MVDKDHMWSGSWSSRKESVTIPQNEIYSANNVGIQGFGKHTRTGKKIHQQRLKLESQTR